MLSAHASAVNPSNMSAARRARVGICAFRAPGVSVTSREWGSGIFPLKSAHSSSTSPGFEVSESLNGTRPGASCHASSSAQDLGAADLASPVLVLPVADLAVDFAAAFGFAFDRAFGFPFAAGGSFALGSASRLHGLGSVAVASVSVPSSSASNDGRPRALRLGILVAESEAGDPCDAVDVFAAPARALEARTILLEGVARALRVDLRAETKSSEAPYVPVRLAPKLQATSTPFSNSNGVSCCSRTTYANKKRAARRPTQSLHKPEMERSPPGSLDHASTKGWKTSDVASQSSRAPPLGETAEAPRGCARPG